MTIFVWYFEHIVAILFCYLYTYALPLWRAAGFEALIQPGVRASTFFQSFPTPSL